MLTHFKAIKPKIIILALLSGFLVLLTSYNKFHDEQQISTQIFNDLTTTTKPKEEILNNLLSHATSGQEFSGKTFRNFPMNLRKFHQTEISSRKKKISNHPCTKWGVVTTIFKPSEAVRRFLYRQDWCVVIVGDEGKPKGRT